VGPDSYARLAIKAASARALHSWHPTRLLYINDTCARLVGEPASAVALLWQLQVAKNFAAAQFSIA